MATATLRRPAPKGDGAWDQLRHVAESAVQRSTAYLTGRYSFTFSNSSDRTVKMHLMEEKADSSYRAQDYMLTVPARRSGVEVPLGCARIRVTAGFFHKEEGSYEIFWENRPFSWEPGLLVEAAARHSVDVNKFRLDVTPGAQEVPRPRPSADTAALADAPVAPSNDVLARRTLRLLVPPSRLNVVPRPDQKADPNTASLLPGLQIFVPGKSGDWVGANVNKELADGSLEVSGEDGKTWVVRPEAQVALALMPPPELVPSRGLPAALEDASAEAEEEEGGAAPPGERDFDEGSLPRLPVAATAPPPRCGGAAAAKTEYFSMATMPAPPGGAVAGATRAEASARF